MNIIDVAVFYHYNPCYKRSIAEQLFLNVVNGLNGEFNKQLFSRNVKRTERDADLSQIQTEFTKLFAALGRRLKFTFGDINIVRIPVEGKPYCTYSAIVENIKPKEKENDCV